jgi:hypothetical protein
VDMDSRGRKELLTACCRDAHQVRAQGIYLILSGPNLSIYLDLGRRGEENGNMACMKGRAERDLNQSVQSQAMMKGAGCGVDSITRWHGRGKRLWPSSCTFRFRCKPHTCRHTSLFPRPRATTVLPSSDEV